MLNQIDIQHLATINELHLELHPGSTVITGETGAGKSIIIDAISLALGARATADMVRPGYEKADISLTFTIHHLPEAKKWLQQFDLDDESGECIIRRSIHKDGRSRSFINGSPITLQILRELADLLIHIHGQHEHHALFKPETQREMLDRYAGHVGLCDTVATLSQEWLSTKQAIADLRLSYSERNARSEFLRFQLNELEALQLKPDEFQALDLEHKQLAHAGELLQNINSALGLLGENEESNAIRSLNLIISTLEEVKDVDPKIATWVENIYSATVQLSDSETEMRHYLDQVDLDPERLKWVEIRLGLLFDMARKHKIAPEELYDFMQRISQELSELDTSDERLEALEAQLQNVSEKYIKAAKKLTDSRAKAAKKIDQDVTKIIRDLALPHGQFHILFEAVTADTYPSHGLEKILFQLATNVGQPLQALAKVASGGELSRISLAIHMVTAEQHTIPTLIFDEVDVGISGGTAEIVGKLLRSLGKTRQLLCITHLPQVAAQGQHHLLVEKLHEKDASMTRLRFLDEKAKIQEIARMLGGVEITKKTLDYAREMLEQA